MKLSILFKPALIGACALMAQSWASTAMAVPITWGGWTFDYEFGVQNDGLALKNVSYQGHTLLKKISMQGVTGQVGNSATGTTICPYYSDQLSGTATPMPWANNATIAQRQFTLNGRQWYEIGARKLINNKDYYQAYYLSSDGLLDANLYTRGEACAGANVIGNTERHIPQWRVDTDVAGAPNDVLEVPGGTPSGLGFVPAGGGFEFYFSFDGSGISLWRVRDTLSNAYVNITKGHSFAHPDGTATTQPDRFNLDSTRIWGRLYRASEDISWPSLPITAVVPFGNSENINSQDVVVWYSDELSHPNAPATTTTWYAAKGLSLISSYSNPLPDVVIDSVSYNNGTFTATIRNRGTAITPMDKSVGVGLFVDGVYKTWASVRLLRPGESGTLQSVDRYLIPNGNHTITAKADDINRFAESDETNNALSKSIALVGPDTTQPSIKITSPTPPSYGNAQVSGTAVIIAANAYDNDKIKDVVFSLEYFPSGVKQVISAPKSNPPYVLSWDSTTVPAYDGTNPQAGGYILHATARDRSGNESTASVNVTVLPTTPIQRPDIAVTALNYDKATGQFTCTIKNVGTGTIPAAAWMGLGYFVDGIERTWTTTYGPLAPGQSKNLGAIGGSYSIPSGSHAIKVIADDQLTVMEGNESNNQLSKSIIIP